MLRRTICLAGLGVVFLALVPIDGSSQGPPDHAAFTELLQEIVVDSLVDYQALVEQGRALDDYMSSLERTDPERLDAAPRADRLAFWLNAYNACMLLRVRDHYPIEPGDTGLFGGIRNWAAGRPDNSVWQIPDVFSGEFCPVAGEARSLDEIEHEIIRPAYGEPRIHFAVNCAAYSCPRLADEAYVGNRLEAQLDRQVRDFVEDSRHFRVEDGSPPVLHLNQVLDWYGEDFGGESRLPGFFASYVDEDERELLERDDLRIQFFEYDWTLNDVQAEHEKPDG